MPASEIRDLVADVWHILEPGSSGAFPVLDNALLPGLLQSIFCSTADGGVQWDDWVTNLAPASQTGSALLESIKARGSQFNSSNLVGAIYSSDPAEKEAAAFLRPMLARTVLLLRIATGSAIQLLRESGYDQASLGFWVESLAEAHGLWSNGESPEDPHDLWADVEIALEDADAAGTGSLYELLRDLNTGALTFGQADRVVAWSFA